MSLEDREDAGRRGAVSSQATLDRQADAAAVTETVMARFLGLSRRQLLSNGALRDPALPRVRSDAAPRDEFELEPFPEWAAYGLPNYADQEEPSWPERTLAQIPSADGALGEFLATLPPGNRLAQLLAQVDLDEVDDYSLIEVTAAFKRMEAWSAARAARAAAALAERPALNPTWPGNLPGRTRGECVAGEELAMRLRVSRFAAVRMAACSRAFEGMFQPTGQALEEGLIDFPRAQAIVMTLEALPSDVAMAVQWEVLDKAPGRTLRQLQQDLAKAIIAVDPDSADDRHRAARKKRCVHRPRPLPDGMAQIGAVLPAADAIALDTALEASARAAKNAGDERTLDQLRADSLALMGHTALALGHIGPRAGQCCTGGCTATTSTARKPENAARNAADKVGSAENAADKAGSAESAADAARHPGDAAHTPSPDEAASPARDAGQRSANSGVAPEDSGPTSSGMAPEDSGPTNSAMAPEESSPTSSGMAPQDSAPAPENGEPAPEDSCPASADNCPATQDSEPAPQDSDPPTDGHHPPPVEPDSPPPRPPTTSPPPHPGHRLPGGCLPTVRLGTLAGGRADVRVTVPLGVLLPDPDAPRRNPLDRLPEPVAELEGYGPVPPVVARALAAGHVWRRIVTDPTGTQVLDVGRTSYQPPVAIADHVRERDGTCVRPGCSAPARGCDLDHLHEWQDGGVTSVDNLGLECRRDHSVKSIGAYTVAYGTDRTYAWVGPVGHGYLRRPDGTVITMPRRSAEGLRAQGREAVKAGRSIPPAAVDGVLAELAAGSDVGGAWQPAGVVATHPWPGVENGPSWATDDEPPF